MTQPDYRKIHQLEVELGIVPDEPYGYSLLREAANLEELTAKWDEIRQTQDDWTN